MRREQDRAAKALDVQRPPHQHFCDVSQATGRDERKWQNKCKGCRRHDGEITADMRAAAPH